MDSDLNVLTELRTLRAEQREDLQTLMLKVDTGFHLLASEAAQTTHELAAHTLEDARSFGDTNLRLVGLETSSRAIKWVGGTLLVGAVGLVVDLFQHHLW